VKGTTIRAPGEKKNKYDMTSSSQWFLSAVIMIGPSGLVLVVLYLVAIPVLVLGGGWGGLKKLYN
jgi:hypothetical protein